MSTSSKEDPMKPGKVILPTWVARPPGPNGPLMWTWSMGTKSWTRERSPDMCLVAEVSKMMIHSPLTGWGSPKEMQADSEACLWHSRFVWFRWECAGSWQRSLGLFPISRCGRIGCLRVRRMLWTQRQDLRHKIQHCLRTCSPISFHPKACKVIRAACKVIRAAARKVIRVYPS